MISVSKPFFIVTSCTAAVNKFVDFTRSYVMDFYRMQSPWQFLRTYVSRTRTWVPRIRTRTCKLVLEDKDFPRGQQHYIITVAFMTITTVHSGIQSWDLTPQSGIRHVTSRHCDLWWLGQTASSSSQKIPWKWELGPDVFFKLPTVYWVCGSVAYW